MKTEPVLTGPFHVRAIRALQPLAKYKNGNGNDSNFQSIVERIAKEIEEAVAEERKANAKHCTRAANSISRNVRRHQKETGKLTQRDLATAREAYVTAMMLAKEIRQKK